MPSRMTATLADLPPDATRILVPRDWASGPAAYLSASDVTACAEEYRIPRDAAFETVSGVDLLHCGKRGVPGQRAVVVWSDGLLTGGIVITPRAHLEDKPPWDPPRRLAAVEPLLAALLEADNFAFLDTTRPWTAWTDATGHQEQPAPGEQRTERALAADLTVARTLGTLQHRITLADGCTDVLWEARALITTTDTGKHHPGTRTVGRTSSYHATQDEALAVLDVWRGDLPPVVSRAEAAELCGTTPAALAMALGRAERAYRPGTRPVWPFAVVETRGHWYDPLDMVRWWPSRPGHGPGRGHRAL